MTATQAPTPGPLDWTAWSGGPRPHPPATRVRVRYRDGTEDEGASAFCDWLHSPRRTDPKDVVAYKVVREATAPVEASGSEDMRRREITAVMTALDSFAVLAGRVTATQAEHVLASLDALRPQPSGETREAVAAIINEARYDTQQARELSELTDAILAVLNLRPLALGGQQGEDWRCPDCGAQADEWFDCCKNPARAEAQDEGAAGEMRAAGWSVAVHNDYRLNGEAHTFWLWTHPDGRWIKGEGRNDASALSQCLAAVRARPSPTPAADNDRVRIAVEALEKAEGYFEAIRLVLINHLNDPERDAFWKAVYGRATAQDAIKALKSTAAKEGGEG